MYPNQVSIQRIPDPSTIIIFGASGDLAHRKLIPALFNLDKKNRLPEGFNIVGYSRTAYTHAEYRADMRTAVGKVETLAIPDDQWEQFADRLFYCRGDIHQSADFENLERFLQQLQAERTRTQNRVYYLAVAPQFYEHIVQNLGRYCTVNQKAGWQNIVIEKPFGHDLESAMQLNRTLHAVFPERHIYRIDHYLGKETAQNILYLRFANTIFEPVWNRNYIDHVQITVSESVDIGHRAGYYEHSGVARDILQNHLMQLLALMTMEPPASFNADALRNEVIKVLSAIRPISIDTVGEHTVRGQYEGYRREVGVSPESQTATYGAFRIYIDNWRWQGVPFYLRTGKAMADKSTEIIIEFKCPPHVLFPLPPGKEITPNRLVMCIQPDEGIQLRFEAKVPDTISEMRSVNMTFDYANSFGGSSIPDAYERLLLDSLLGDASLFTRSDAIQLAWAFVDPILESWEKHLSPPLAIYPRGSWGPTEADDFIARDSRIWQNGCGGQEFSPL